MPRIMVGLLEAVGAAMSALVAYTHGDLTWITIADAAFATGLAAYAAAPVFKKSSTVQLPVQLPTLEPPRSAPSIRNWQQLVEVAGGVERATRRVRQNENLTAHFKLSVDPHSTSIAACLATPSRAE